MKENEPHTRDVPLSEGRYSWIEWLRSIWEIIKILFGQKPGEHPVQYFTPGKIILHIEHPDSMTPGDLAIEIGKFLERQDENLQLKSQLAPPKQEDILTFRRLKDSASTVLSVVSTPLRDEKANQQDLINLLTNLDAQRSKGVFTISGNVSVKSIAPDWFVGSASHGIGTTGPGAWPVEVPEQPTENAWVFQRQEDQQSKQNAPSLFVNNPTRPVYVAILDTVPTDEALRQAYTRWSAKHPLLKQLWAGGANPKLKVNRNIPIDLNFDNAAVRLTGHQYSMPDHGLFVAGIINSIAPQAELHLIETFTQYGISSAETITRALLQALDLPRPLIINCSFNLSRDNIGSLPAVIQGMATSLQEIFDRLATQDDVIVVAAAGNDAEDGNRPPTRFPAAFDSVIGVGALPRESLLPSGEYKAASYSNLAHSHPHAGYMALGGEPGSGQGVLGVYTGGTFPVYAPGCLSLLWRLFSGWKGPGHLPPYPSAFTAEQVGSKPNKTGWAWWAGTSFATPVVSGILANWCGMSAGPINLANARLALNARSQTTTTAQGENVILLAQGDG